MQDNGQNRNSDISNNQLSVKDRYLARQAPSKEKDDNPGSARQSQPIASRPPSRVVSELLAWGAPGSNLHFHGSVGIGTLVHCVNFGVVKPSTLNLPGLKVEERTKERAIKTLLELRAKGLVYFPNECDNYGPAGQCLGHNTDPYAKGGR